MEHIYGVNPVIAALKAKKREFKKLYVKTGQQKERLAEACALAYKMGLKVAEVDPQKLDGLANTTHHQSIVLECGLLPTLVIEDLIKRTPKLIIALDQIKDPQNVGAIIRSAAFLGADAIIHLDRNAAPLGSTVSKTSAGAMETFPIAQVQNLDKTLKILKKQGYFVYGASTEKALPYKKATLQDKLVLVMGNEGKGLRPLTAKGCDQMVYIPGRHGVESLNVSAAAAILLAHFGFA
ncbi:MAG: 23S rRNA (guanosine(2251)-2'-O)-methyltransferase RlmB [SAR324 cluster bacterium]|nr:23S rRNA (guanosine(2251)-2'-O)-methyltransferase RlmB [SAR324 cluster bacterium]